jgi:membrane-bound lytic murein transglycosylase B
VLAIAVGALGAASAGAQESEQGFQAYLPTLARQAADAGVSRRTIDLVVPTLTFNPRVVELDRQQPESRPNAPIPAFEPYRRQHVDAQRIARGRAAYQRQRWRLQKIERIPGFPNRSWSRSGGTRPITAR